MSHHQKLVIIDGKIAFVGGMDICSARWDDRAITTWKTNTEKMPMNQSTVRIMTSSLTTQGR